MPRFAVMITSDNGTPKTEIVVRTDWFDAAKKHTFAASGLPECDTLKKLQDMMFDGDITIDVTEIPEDPVVQDRLLKLTALEMGGVDNWSWYDDAMDYYRQNCDEEHALY